MKLAIHQPRVSYFVGGGEIVPLEQASRLKNNHEVHLITSDRPKSDVLEKFINDNPEIEIRYFSIPDEIYEIQAGHNQIRWDSESLEFGKATSDFYKEEHFDAVITHYTTDSIFMPKNNILHLHGFPHMYRDLDALCLKVPKGYVSVAKFVSENWKNMHNLNDIRLNYNGISHQKFVQNGARKDIDIGYIGRLLEIKGIDDLIFAVHKVKKKYHNISAVIAGKGPDEQRLKQLCSSLGLTGNIEFAGYVPDNDLVNFYNHTRISVLPSYAREGVLTTMLESSSCGTPVITSNCCGMKEFILDGCNGRLAEPRNSKQLAQIMEELLLNDGYREKLGMGARKSIVDEWTWEKRIKELEYSYESIIEAKK